LSKIDHRETQLLMVQHISEASGPNYTKFGQDIVRSLLRSNFFYISDMSLRFETTVTEMRLGSKIEAKFCIFWPCKN